MFQFPFPVNDANASQGDKNLGNLPEWDLNDLYTAPDAPELGDDLSWLEKECAAFATDYEGKLGTLNAEDMSLRDPQRKDIDDRGADNVLCRSSVYQMTTDGERTKFLSDCQEKITNFTTPLVFFSLELNRLEDDHIEGLLSQNGELGRYRRVFERMRAMKPHQLSDELEKFIHDLGAVGDAWEKLFDETIAGLSFVVEGVEKNIEGTLDFLTGHDRAKREAAARELSRVFAENIKIFARAHNTLAKEKEILDRWRKMPSAQAGRHLSNDVEPEVVEALRNAVVAAYPKLSHRYYELKRKWLGWIKCKCGIETHLFRWKPIVW